MKTWQQPNTTRRYLHPPKSERIVTLWSEGKLVLGEVELAPGPTVPKYTEIISCGIWPVYGPKDLAADFKTAENILHDDGIPVHTVKNTFGSLSVTMEVLCDTARKSSAFVKLSLSNPKENPEQFGLLLRTGLESRLIFDAPDVYMSYAPDVQVWKDTPATWKQDNGIFRDGEYFLRPLSGQWEFDPRVGKLHITAQPKQQLQLTLVLGKGEVPGADYESQKQQTIIFYQKELTRLAQLPPSMDNQMVRNLVLQLLQCFSTPVDMPWLLCRQGGLQRRIWPFEAMYALEALDRLGDFDDYIEPVIDLYFNVLQEPTGEVVPLGIYWAMATAVSIYSFGDHAIRKGKDFYEQHRQRVMAGFDFIKNTRVREASDPGVVPGLFPPKRSCDAANVLQAWTLTDTHNLIGLKKLAEAAKLFEDPRAEEIQAEYTDYHRVIQGCFDRAKAIAGDSDKLVITNYVPGTGGDESMHPFRPHMGIVASVLEVSREDLLRIENVLWEDNARHEGLYARMPDHYRRHDPDGIVRMWYTTLEEFYWFDSFQRLGMQERCTEIIDSILKYSMTKEYQMVERYHEHDPWFVPWSPNASANGRLLLLLQRSNQNAV